MHPAKSKKKEVKYVTFGRGFGSQWLTGVLKGNEIELIFLRMKRIKKKNVKNRFWKYKKKKNIK